MKRVYQDDPEPLLRGMGERGPWGDDWWAEAERELRWTEVDLLAEPKDGDEFI